MGWEAWTTIGAVGLVFALLALTNAAPDLIFVGVVTLLMTAGILSPSAALSGLSNEGVITVGVLYIVAAGLRDGDEEIAANFWSGFAQGAGNYLVGPVDAADSGTIEEGGIEFSMIAVTPADGDSRRLYLRDEDGYRVDLFASFGPGLADKMIEPAERLLTTQTEDARLVLQGLEGIVPSLLLAAHQEGVPGDVSQQILSLVEVITRVG